MKESIISFTTQDNLTLHGILFELDTKGSKVAIFLHGNGSSDMFDGYESQLKYAEKFIEKGISYLALNNRGARYIQKFKYKDSEGNKQVIWGGMTNELIKECLIDIDDTIKFLKSKNYTEFYLIGSSTGANKIVLYDFYKKENEVSKYILCSGGDDTGIYYEILGDENYWKLLKLAKEKILNEKGLETSMEMGVLFSYRSIFDTLNPDGDYNIFSFYEAQNRQLGTKEIFKEFKSIKKPTLVLYGELDEHCKPTAKACIEILEKQVTGKDNFRFNIIQEGDHALSVKEYEVADIEIQFILSNI